MKALILDLDGTLYPLSNGLPKLIDKKVEEFFLINGIDDIKTLERKIPNVLEAVEFFCLKQEAFVSYVYEDIDYRNFIRFDFRLRCVLKKIECRLIVVSLSPLKHIYSVLEILGVKDLIFECYSLCESLIPHHKKEIYRDIVQKYNLNPSEILCVGDSLSNDIIPALEAGMQIRLISESKSDYPSIRNIYELSRLEL